MFTIVTYPWPATSSHVELTGPQPQDDSAASRGSIDQRGRDLEEMVCWSDWERLAIRWCRFRLAIREIRRTLRG